MARYENYIGDVFETEDDARDDAYSKITWDDYEDYFSNNISYHKLFEFARAHEDFFTKFENEFCEADEKYFQDNYSIIDEEDENEEEE